MSSYFSNLLTQTTDRVNSIRQNIFTSEADGDTEDDTHICRVLRGYYTEKGRPFPGWLPPDPKAPTPIQPVYTNNVGTGYGGFQQSSSAGGGSTGLSSLWDQPAGGGGGGQAAPQSLRQGRGARGHLQVGSGLNDPYNRTQSKSADPPVQARPLPSQRAGSYQTSVASPMGRSESTVSSAGSASEKLKARLWGAARAASPSALSGPSPPPASTPSPVYRSDSSSSGNYEDRFAPGNSVYAPPPTGRYGSASEAGGGQGGGGRQRPAGLPSGPRMGGGLPSGPRMR